MCEPTDDHSSSIPGFSDLPQPAVAEYANQLLEALAEGLQVALMEQQVG